MGKTKKSQSNKVKYRLYACELTEENITAVEAFRFYRITSKYILLYYGGRRITNYNEITENELNYLSYDDQRWLLDCNMAIIAEETMKHQDEVANNMGLMLDRLEKALQNEKAQVMTHDRPSKS